MTGDDRPYLIGVAGGSNSGKTTIAERLADVVGDRQISLIRLDSYYVAMPDLTLEERAAMNAKAAAMSAAPSGASSPCMSLTNPPPSRCCSADGPSSIVRIR